VPGLAQQNHGSRCNPALIKAIARGRAWFEELASGRVRSLQELAKRDGITRRYIRRLGARPCAINRWLGRQVTSRSSNVTRPAAGFSTPAIIGGYVWLPGADEPTISITMPTTDKPLLVLRK
jgi:hypothetical protein